MSENNGGVVGIVAAIMVLLTAVNMGFTYYMVGQKTTTNESSESKVVTKEVDTIKVEDPTGLSKAVIAEYLNEQYKMYGGKDNYEKVAIMQSAQIEQQFGNTTVEEIKKQMADAAAQAQAQAEAERMADQVQDLGDKAIGKAEYVQGPESATITVYEHSDFNCVHCKKLHDSGIAERLLGEYSDLNFVQKNRPVIGGANSMMKANAAMCIGELGGTEAYYKGLDFLYIAQTEDDIKAQASEIGVDGDALVSCIGESKYNDLLQETILEWSSFGISGTPGSVVVNNKTGKFKVVKGAAPYESFAAAVDELLAE